MYIGRSAKHHYQVIQLLYGSSSNKGVFTINVDFAPSDISYESGGKLRSPFTNTISNSLKDVFLYIYSYLVYTHDYLRSWPHTEAHC